MKTTAEAAETLGIKPDKLSRILSKYPSYRPETTFGGWAVWMDADIDKARKIVERVLHGNCPFCGKHPDFDPQKTYDAE